MRIAVVIPTVDRPDALRRVLAAVREQTLAPCVIVVSPPRREMLPDDVLADPGITVVDGARGASAQRNRALTELGEDVDLVAFFDDDAIPRSDYLEQMASAFKDESMVGATGTVLLDGAVEKRELPVHEMEGALRSSWSRNGARVRAVTGLYGANMVVRAQQAVALRFDERLPLYSWLEDLDFSRRLLIHGRLGHVDRAVCVHQGSDSGGRQQHRRLGYSQVANVAYLKGKRSIGWVDVARLAGRPVLASLVGSIVGGQKAQRRQRLRGMGLAASDLVRGRVTPERITSL